MPDRMPLLQTLVVERIHTDNWVALYCYKFKLALSQIYLLTLRKIRNSN